jgi:signal transduction histidine kinase
MTYMGPVDYWRGAWAGQWRRIAAAPHAPAVAGGLLGLIAVAESTAHAASAPQAATTGGVVLYALLLCLLGLATTVPLVFLRPAAAAVAISAACVLSLAVFQVLTVAGLGAELIAVYRLGRSGAQWKGAQLLAAGLAVPFLVLALTGPRPTGSEEGILTVLLASLVPAAAWGGIAQRARSEALVHSAARQVIAGTLLEHTARGERARIARELHDVVAHHISMIAVQSETARLTTPGMPAAGAERLTAIGDTARSALTEMRRLLGVLREDADVAAPDLRPQPGLQQLNELLDEARDASGSAARLILSGRPATLDPGVELAAYRIIQEALTNARRHAPGAAVDVELHHADGYLNLRIRDNGPGSAADATPNGHGLTGMRERAGAVGGRLRTGPAAGGGFLVEATLPTSNSVESGT